MRHDLKCWPEFFERLLDGSKTFEVRKDDRGYQAGDELLIREWRPGSTYTTPTYTGRAIEFRVGFIFKAGFGVDLGQHVVMSLIPLATESAI